MNYKTEAQPWAPQSTHNAQMVLPTRPNYPMFAKWWPANWVWQTFEVTKTVKGVGKAKDKEETTTVGVFVPNVEFETIRPGVNGVRQIRGEIGDVSNRIGQLQREGWIYLDPKRHDYIRAYPARGGQYFADRFTDIRVLANRMIKTFDRNDYNKWCVTLLANGELGHIEPQFWQLLIRDFEKRPDRLIRQQHLPEIKQRIDDLNAQLVAMRQFVNDYKTNGIELYKQVI
jgi:hypothetical protein